MEILCENPCLCEEQNELDEEADNDINATKCLLFDFATIKLATNNFSDVNKIGQGGFGSVYKGTLSEGQEVAIKRLSNNTEQGETEFKTEVSLAGKLQHQNVVKILGYCVYQKKKLLGYRLQTAERLIIYEFVPNKSLDYIIFDPIKRANLDWERRYKIIKGIAGGLLYLHDGFHLKIGHGDLKPSNILLDEEWNPKISDFGIAKWFDADEYITRPIVGTFGYIAPEYMKRGYFSAKSDVFSFGVIILEIVCGRRNIVYGGDNVYDLVSIVWRNWKAETTSDIVDPIINHGSEIEIMRCIHIGLLCVQEEIDDRPTMTSVLLMLNITSFPLAEPSETGYLMQPERLSSIQSTEQYLGGSSIQSTEQYLGGSSDSGSQPTQGSTSTKSSAEDYYTSLVDISIRSIRSTS